MIRRLTQLGIAVVATMLLTSAPAHAQANQDAPDVPGPGAGFCPGNDAGGLVWAAQRVPYAISWTMVDGRWRPCM